VALALASSAGAWWLGSYLGLGPCWVAATALTLFFAPHVAMGVASFALSWSGRTVPAPELRIGPFAAIGCVLREILTSTVAYVFLQPFPRFVMPDEPRRANDGRLAVLLVHGYVCNAAVWAWMTRSLGARGHPTYTLTLEPVFSPIEDYVAPLARRIDELAGEAGRVILVAHSMGGLVCRAYVRRFGGARVARLVTLGAPHHGSALAAMGPGADAVDMQPGGAWLRELTDEGGQTVPITSIYTVHDNLVVPQDSSVLAGAKNVPLAGVGHLSLLFSSRVAALVDAELRG
jgi:triacylglycerol lipase